MWGCSMIQELSFDDKFRFNHMYDFWSEYPLDIASDQPVTVMCSSHSQIYARDVFAAHRQLKAIDHGRMREVAGELFQAMGLNNDLAIAYIAARVSVVADRPETKDAAVKHFGEKTEMAKLFTAMVFVLDELRGE